MGKKDTIKGSTGGSGRGERSESVLKSSNQAKSIHASSQGTKGSSKHVSTEGRKRPPDVKPDEDEPVGASSLLSPELRAQLGLADDASEGAEGTGLDIIYTSSKKKQKQSSSGSQQPGAKKKSVMDSDSEPEEESDKPLSKNQQRKLDQLTKRKEKEAKRSEHLKELDKYRLEAGQQELMVSAREHGQKHTLRWRLRNALKRYKAGITLTEEEHSLLFPYGTTEMAHFSDDEEITGTIVSAGSQLAEKRSKPSGLPSDQTATAAPSDVATMPMDAKKMVSKVTDTVPTTAASTTSAPSASMSLGERLMAQFKQIKTVADQQNIQKQNEEAQQSEPSLFTSKTSLDASALAHMTESQRMVAQGGPTESEKYVPKDVIDVDTVLKRLESARPAAEAGSKNAKELFMVTRKQDIQFARMQLPVCGMEQEIVETINQNDVVILCGETGSGKSTQVPQFLYEAGYCGGADGEGFMIGITQPRRVAASSTAIRVAIEMNCPIFAPNNPTVATFSSAEADNDTTATSTADSNTSSKAAKKAAKRQRQSLAKGATKRLVGYQVRHDSSTVGADTRIKFMTDGILLKEITSDLLLRQYSAILLDEAHERGVNTDVLLGMLSRAIMVRKAQAEKEERAWRKLSQADRCMFAAPIKPLKLIIMSATLRVDDFLSPTLFPTPPPVVKVEARQFPVTPHFARRTEMNNYLKEAFRKVLQIHKRLPEGGILVFLTGKREIMHFTRKLRQRLCKPEKQANQAASASISTTATQEVDEFTTIDQVDVGMWDTAEEQADVFDDIVHSSKSSGSRKKKLGQKRSKTSNGDGDGWGGDDLDDVNTDSDLDDLDDLSEDDDEDDMNDKSSLAADSAMDVEASQGKDEQDDEESAKRRELLFELLRGGESGGTVVKTGREEDDAANKDDKTAAPNSGDAGSSLEETRPKLKALVLPLFAMLTPDQQRRVFEPVAEDTRLIVIATNVAETSITIPGIKYVVDCGRQKEKTFDAVSGISKYEVRWICKASADQRMGRAGRTGPGHCYRLYSSAFYDQHMVQFQEPEIVRTPLEDLLLQMRVIGIDDVERFPFPSPPPKLSLISALYTLKSIAAVVTQKTYVTSNALVGKNNQHMSVPRCVVVDKVSSLGQWIAKFPINVRFAKMLIVAHRSNDGSASALSPMLVCSFIAAMSEKSPFLIAPNRAKVAEEPSKAADSSDGSNSDDSDSEMADRDEENKASSFVSRWFHHTSDGLSRLRALGAYCFAIKQFDETEGKQAGKAPGGGGDVARKRQEHLAAICAKWGVSQPSLDRSRELAAQLYRIYSTVFELNDQTNTSAVGSGSTSNSGNSASRKRALADSSSDGVSSREIGGLHAAPTAASVAFSPPSTEQELALRQILVSGLPDCVARRAPIGSVQANAATSRRMRLTAYMSCSSNITELLYIHPDSCLYQKDPTARLPEYVVYHQLVKNESGACTYMVNCTAIEPSWLSALTSDTPLLTWPSEPLASPPPYYDSGRDAVVATAAPKYGVHGWELAPERREMTSFYNNKDDSTSTSDSSSNSNSTSNAETSGLPGYRKQDAPVRWFARLLFENVIFGEDVLLRGVLGKDKCKVSSSDFTSMKVTKAAAGVLVALAKASVCSKASLHARLVADNTFLFEEIQQCIKLEHRKEFRVRWRRYISHIMESNATRA